MISRHWTFHCVKSVQIQFFLVCIFLYSVEYRKTRTRKNFLFEHFSRSVFIYYSLVLIYISIADLHDMKTLMYFMLLNILNGTQTKERVEEGNFPEEFWSNGSSETDYIDNESNLWMENLSRDRSNVMRIIQIVFDCAEIYKNFIMTNSHSNNRQRCSIKKGVLKYFGKFTENNLRQSLF